MIGEETGTVETESFAELLDAHSQASERFRQGMRVKCTVVAITADTIFVSTGDKVDGIVERKEFEDAGGNPSCAVGDELELYVTVATPHEVRLSKALAGGGGVSMLKDAQESGIPVEGKVMATVKGGYSVEVMKRRAFCPFSQMDVRPVESPDAMIGQSFNFLVSKVEQGGRNITVSRRALLERENIANRDAFMSKVQLGDILEGKVARLVPFGAFVELTPGVEGLVHLSELAWSRVRQADEVLTVGDAVRVKLVAIGAEDKAGKISLSIRQVTEDPWKDVNGRLEPGQMLNGKVMRLAQFGAFIEILPGIEGLAHISEFSYERRISKPEDMLVVGDQVSVKVKEIDIDKKRIALSIREAAGDPWLDVAERFTVGAAVQGVIEKREKFGVFVKLSPGVVGLLPGSVLASAKKGVYERLGVGDSIELIVNNIDAAARKISLGIPEENIGSAPVMGHPGGNSAGDGRGKPGGAERGDKPGGGDRPGGRRRERGDEKGDRNWKEHAPKNESFGGSLGLALKAAMNKNK